MFSFLSQRGCHIKSGQGSIFVPDTSGRKKYSEVRRGVLSETKRELEEKLKRLLDKYHQYGKKKKTAFENYALGILDKDSYQEVKNIYENAERDSQRELIAFQKYKEDTLNCLRVRIEWSRQLLQHTKLKEITKGMVENFIEGIYIYSKTEIEIQFWFADIFENALLEEEVGHEKER